MTDTWGCAVSPQGLWKAKGHQGHRCSTSFTAAWLQLAMELPFWGQVRFLWAPSKLRGCTAASSPCANQVPAPSSSVHCLWLRRCEALLKLFSSSTLTRLESSRDAFTVVKYRKGEKPHSLETPVSLLKSLTLAIHWNFQSSGDVWSFNSCSDGWKKWFGTQFAHYMNWWVLT